MAKVKPGPVVSSVAGAVGPVVYYECLGRTVVRTRVRPHQKISSKRYWNRWQWQQLMLWWRLYFSPLYDLLNDWARTHHMYAVNKWISLNKPYAWPLNTFFVGDRRVEELVTVTRIEDPGWDIIHIVWDPADFPAWWRLIAFCPPPDPTHHRHYTIAWVNDGDHVSYTGKHPDSWWYVGVVETHSPGGHLVFRAARADVPVE